MKKWLGIGLLVLAAIGTMFATTELTKRFFFAKEEILRVEVIPIDFKVDNYVGIVTDPDALHFGTIPPGNHGKRWISLKNDNTFPIRVTARFTGDAREYAWTKPEIVLAEGEARTISVSITVPADLPHGNYTGTAYFTFRKAEQ